ncbi:MAG: M12 family metallo-peptidase [Methanoregula sp.]
MNIHKTVVVLLALLLAGMAMVPMVNAAEDLKMISADEQHQNIPLTIEGETTIVASGIDASNISSTKSLEQYAELNIPKTIKNLDIIQFENVQLKSNGTNRIPITIYGKPNLLILERMNFENIDDGIDSYSGKIEGMDKSLALFTFGGKVVQGYLELDNETITIVPVENRINTEKASHPLHIVYSSKNVINSDKANPVDHGLTPLPLGVTLSTQPIARNPATMNSVLSYATVSILIATDNAFYTQEANWVSSANQIMSMVSYQYDRADIQVMFNVVSYDASKRTQLSNDPLITTEPWNAFHNQFSLGYLQSNGADIAVYLGGYDIEDGTQGAAWGYGSYPGEYCRYAWSQMVTDTDDGLPVHIYDGSLHARRYCVIHELGHIFNANHEDSSGTNRAYAWYTPSPKYTAMWSGYYGSSINTHEYSSPSYHGDSTHNNAGAINAVKYNIASLT